MSSIYIYSELQILVDKYDKFMCHHLQKSN